MRRGSPGARAADGAARRPAAPRLRPVPAGGAVRAGRAPPVRRRCRASRARPRPPRRRRTARPAAAADSPEPAGGARRVRRPTRAGTAPSSCATTSSVRSRPPCSVPTPCQSGSRRARATGGTGSTSRRRRASDRRRSERSTSGSHHSRPEAPGMGENSPSSTTPCSASRRSVSWTSAAGRLQRSAGWRAAKGPWVRAQRSEQAGQGVDGVRQEDVRHAARRLDAHRVAIASDVLDRDPALIAADAHRHRAALLLELGQPLLGFVARRACDDLGGRAGPRAAAAGRGSDRRCEPAARPATAARARGRSSADGSSSSRSSSWPSSSRNRSRSSASAWARRSASGASPSYMNSAM